MPVEVAIWRLGSEGRTLVPTPMPSEAELESLIAGDESVLGLDVLLIGRQVMTAYGKRIDLLGIDSEGDLHVIELKRDRTPREVVAQALDYGSWVKSLDFDAVATISAEYAGGARLEELFADRFGTSIPEAINQEHHLVVVASELDSSTERIVGYLSGLGVPVNVVFFRHFVDEGRRVPIRRQGAPPRDLADTCGADPRSPDDPSRTSSRATVARANFVPSHTTGRSCRLPYLTTLTKLAYCRLHGNPSCPDHRLLAREEPAL